MDLAIQIISNGQTVGSETIQDLKDFSSQLFINTSWKRKLISFYDACD